MGIINGVDTASEFPKGTLPHTFASRRADMEAEKDPRLAEARLGSIGHIDLEPLPDQGKVVGACESTDKNEHTLRWAQLQARNPGKEGEEVLYNNNNKLAGVSTRYGYVIRTHSDRARAVPDDGCRKHPKQRLDGYNKEHRAERAPLRHPRANFEKQMGRALLHYVSITTGVLGPNDS